MATPYVIIPGVRKEGQEGREDYKNKVLYPFKPLLLIFWGPPVEHIDSLGVCGAKKAKKHCDWATLFCKCLLDLLNCCL